MFIALSFFCQRQSSLDEQQRCRFYLAKLSCFQCVFTLLILPAGLWASTLTNIRTCAAYLCSQEQNNGQSGIGLILPGKQSNVHLYYLLPIHQIFFLNVKKIRIIVVWFLQVTKWYRVIRKDIRMWKLENFLFKLTQWYNFHDLL